MDPQDRAFLKDEYLKLQDQYEDYDRRSLTIKGWVSVGAAVATVSGFRGDGLFGIAPWLVIATLASTFWYLEARWKQFQYALAGRLQEIEGYFRGEGPELKPLQMYSSWFANYRLQTGRSSLWAAANQNFVRMPYVAIIAICVIGIALQFAQHLWGA